MSTAVRVGLFMTVCLLVLGFFILRIEDFDLFARGTQKVDAVFDSVAGLDDKAAVRVAGSRSIEAAASGQLPLLGELSLISRAATVVLATTISRHRQMRSMTASSSEPGPNDTGRLPTIARIHRPRRPLGVGRKRFVD